MTVQEIPGLVEKCRRAQTQWAELPCSERIRCMKKAALKLGENRNEIAEMISRESGKLVIDAMAAEVIPALMAFSYYLRRAKRLLKPHKIRHGSLLMFNKRSSMVYAPWGVVGIISPWNYPFSIPFSEVIMALLAGNGVILKTASVTAGCGQAIASILDAAGLPEGLFVNVEMPGKDAGPALINGGIDKLFFTGSTATGSQLMALAAARLLPLTLELGGADAAIVRADADIDRAVSGIIWAGFSNAGQSCAGIQRVLVHQDIYRQFMKKLADRVTALRSAKGGYDKSSCDLGPMVSIKQKEKFLSQINSCIEKGAQISAQSLPALFTADVSGGTPEDDDLFVPALVLTNVQKGMPIMDDEIFGPVIGVVPFENDREALDIANDSPYGLCASVWTRNRKLAKKMACELNAGSVMINDHLMSHGLPETPWGGFGYSGFGRTHGETGFREMLKAKVIVDDILSGTKRNIWWQPYSQKVYAGLSAIGDFFAGKRRVRAIPEIMGIFFRMWKKDERPDS